MLEVFYQSAYSAEAGQSTCVRLADITNPDKARELFRSRRSSGAVANSKFDSGDHYQNGLGYIGAKPLTHTAGYSQTMLQIREGFVSENVIKEVVDRHIAGILGREPLWGFLPSDAPHPTAERRRKLFSKLYNLARDVVQRATGGTPENVAQEADEALTAAWWNTRKVRKSLKKAVRTALLEERSVIRFFFPNGARDEDNKIPAQTDLSAALTIPQIEVLTSDKAGVFIDEDTQQEFGLYIYKTSDEKDAAWLTYVENGLTVLRVMVDKKNQTTTFELGGRLLMYEIERDPLITEQIRSLQRSLNLARTMMVRNINLAGSLERWLMNVEQPKKKVRITDDTDPRGYREEMQETGGLLVGAGVTNYATGLLVRDENGKIVNRANPNIEFRNPIETTTFTGTRDDLYAAMLSGTFQRFALISGDATAAGRSRVEARAEFATSLSDSKDVVDDCGRWLLETELRLGALLCGKSKAFLPLRCDFNAVVETGPITPEEREANRADVAAGLLSKETAMSRNGNDDTDAELERIAQEPQPRIDLTKDGEGERPTA